MVLFGIPVGSLVDFIWNMLVLIIALPKVVKIGQDPSSVKVAVQGYLPRNKRIKYCIFITLIGIMIDWAYIELTWDVDFMSSRAEWLPIMSQGLQFVLLIVPMVLLGMVNFALTYSYLKLDRKHAIIMGAIMGFFTAPWLLPILPYTLGWVIT